MLTDTKVRAAKAAEKPYKLADSGGLHLLVTTAGGRLWRFRYRWNGKEKLLSLGAYPAVGLADARGERDKAKTSLRNGVDPSYEKQQRKAAGLTKAESTLEVVGRAWHSARKAIWSERHAQDVLDSLEPIFRSPVGKLPIADATPALVLQELRKIEDRGAIETAHRVRQRLSDIFVFGIAGGVCSIDPAATVKRALLPVVRGKQPAITDLDQAKVLLGRVEDADGYALTRMLHRFLVLTNVRPGEALRAAWGEIEGLDADTPLWVIPPHRMKMKREHLVPLSKQAADLLRVVRAIGMRSEYIFPSVRGWKRPMSENTLESLIHRAGYHGRHVPHGWRATFSTIMNERYATGVDHPCYELGGPRTYTYADLIRRVADEIGTRIWLVPLPFALWEALAFLSEFVPGAPITRNQVALMRRHNVASGDLPGLRDLHIAPTALEDVVATIASSSRTAQR